MKGKITVLIGLVLMLGGMLWYAAMLNEETVAANEVREVTPQLRQVIMNDRSMEPIQNDPQQDMTQVLIDGISYVGVLEIPSLSLELPVIASWSSENGKVAPCRYSGRVDQDNMILCAHNYDSHFGRLDSLAEGDEILFTDPDGKIYYYYIKEMLILDGAAVAEIQEGEWDLTLFTCTSGGRNRQVVRCISSNGKQD